MSFTITKDLISDYTKDDDSREGVTWRYPFVPIRARLAGYKSEPLPGVYPLIQFRLMDDDDEVYYEGWLHDDPECLNQSAARDWGEADAGAVKIQVKRNGRWVYEIG